MYDVFHSFRYKKNRYNNAQNVHIKDLSQYSKIKLYKNRDVWGSANACCGGFDHFCGGNADRWGYNLRGGLWWGTVFRG